MKYENIANLAVCFIVSSSLKELSQLTRYKIADHFGINRNYLSKKFKEGTHLTVLQFIEFEKMKRAEYMIKTRLDLPIKAISAKVGIADVKQFRKKFKCHYGLNPGRYRSLFKS